VSAANPNTVWPRVSQALGFISFTPTYGLTRHNLVKEEGRGVLEVITHYAKTWLLLKEYDGLCAV
jgi:hypothetical protein